MLKNYLKIAWRNLWKNKSFSFINISGLAIGMASAVLILLWIENESSYDRFHKNGPDLYEAWNRATFNGTDNYWNNTPKVLGPTLKNDYPEVEQVARAQNQWFVAKQGEKKVSADALIVDPAFLTMFSFPLIAGNPNTALNGANDIVLTASFAKNMFGKDDAVGKMIQINEHAFKVSGVLKDLPPNTRFSFDYLLPFTFMKVLDMGNDDLYWGNNSCNTFVQLKPNVNPETFNSRIRDITFRHTNGSEPEKVFLHPSKLWHLYSEFSNGKVIGGQIDTVRMFAVIAAFILLIACINFMNLSTARSEKRAKEVGIRKVSGAYKSSLVLQFLGESLFISVISGVVALLLVLIFLPSFDTLVGKELRLPFENPSFWLATIAFVLLTGLLAGSYPAFFLASFRPVSVLKGTFRKAQALFTPRKVLVVIQFSFAIVLIISTLVVVSQIRFAQNRKTGYDKRGIVYHFLTGDLNKNYALVKNELVRDGIAVSVNRMSTPITEQWSDTWGIVWEGKGPSDKTDFARYSSDEDLVKTAGLTIAEGRDFDLAKFPTDSMGVLLNEAAVKAMGFKRPLGQLIRDDSISYHVVGVLKDFVILSPYEPVRPIFIEGIKSHNGLNVIHMRLNPAKPTAELMTAMEKIFRKYNPQYPFEYHFVDEEYAKKFADTQRTATLSSLFTGLTILISCLGLFGLASFMAGQRAKEIGVRKVLGASVFNLWKMLSKDFVWLILISLAIATPLAWYFMNDWLQQFNYRAPLSLWIFLAAGLGAIAITLATVSYQSIKASLANPVKSLRSE